MKRKFTTVLFVLMIVSAGAVHAQKIGLHGFVQANYALRAADTRGLRNVSGQPLSDYLIGDQRLQLELTRFGRLTSMMGKVDVFYDSIARRADFEVREAYVDLPLGNFDIRAGRQIITWGVGDLIFVNDVFSKDWVAFLSGRPLEYLKSGSDALNVNFYGGLASVQVVAIPFYQPDILPRGQRLVGYDPFSAATSRIENLPARSLNNAQTAMRLYRYVGNYDVALYAYRGFYPNPAGMKFDAETGVLTTFYPRLHIYGASLQGAFLNGVVSLESGYYDSREDVKGDDPTIENAQFRFLLGYQQAFGEEFTLGLQYYGVRMHKHSQYVRFLPSGFPQRNAWRHTISLRLTQFLNYQTVRLSFFTFYSPNEKDYYVNPEAQYRLGDDVWFAAGSIIVGGKKDHTFLGQFDKNDSVYFVARYTF